MDANEARKAKEGLHPFPTRVRVVSDGTPHGTHVSCAGCGQPFLVREANVLARAGKPTLASLVVEVEVDTVAEVGLSRVEFDPKGQPRLVKDRPAEPPPGACRSCGSTEALEPIGSGLVQCRQCTHVRPAPETAS